MLGRLVKAILRGDFASSTIASDSDALAFAGTTAFQNLDFSTAAELLMQAHLQHPLDAMGRAMLGTALLYGGQLAAAERMLRSALALDPSEVKARKMLAMKYLYAGDWKEGFRLYEEARDDYVLKTPGQKLSRDWLACIRQSVEGIAAWRGEALDGKRILVWSEYGHGDAMMNLRFLPVLRDERGAGDVAFLSMEVEKCLFEAVGGKSFHEAIWGWRPAPGQYDFHCSLISLPYLLEVDLTHIPGRQPYLEIPPAKIDVWRQRLSEIRGLRVGLSWAGNPDMPLDPLRSIALKKMAALFSVEGVSYFSLQKDRVSRDALSAQGLPVIDLMDHVEDFMDTAGLMQHLDLVISVDTALAHLAGATGRPVWLLNRFESEWRWMRDRDDTPWYPTMRIFNQSEPRNWELVLDRVAVELQVLARARPAGSIS